jgi:hypothetical protein
MKPMMVVESTWRKSRKPMTAQEQKAFDEWANEEHMADLLRDTGMVRVTRYRNKDGSGYLWIQEYESEEALEKYLVSERRQELIHETESHYPGGGAGDMFEKRVVRCFIPIASKERK